MQWRDDDTLDEVPKNFWETTGVTKYLQNHIKSANGDNLFEFVYPQINGTREFLIYWENFGDAQSFMSNTRGELARNMNIRSINDIFLNPKEAYEQSKLPAWKPFTRAANIKETIIQKPSYKKQNKRVRVSSEKEEFVPKADVYTKRSTTWERAGGGIQPNPNPIIQVNEPDNSQPKSVTNNVTEFECPRSYSTIASTTQPDSTSTFNEKIKFETTNLNLLQKKILELESSVVNMEQKTANIPNESVSLLKEEMQSISNESHRVLKSIISNELKEEIKNQNVANISDMMASFEKMMAKQTITLRADLNHNHAQISEKLQQEMESIQAESTAQNDELYDMMANKIAVTSDNLTKRMANIEGGGNKSGNQRITRAQAKKMEKENMMFDSDEEQDTMEIEKELHGDHTVVLTKKND
jgi:hypothetical protein